MKFAIRQLTITCVLPAALWQGPLMTDTVGQNPFPSANSKMNADRPQKRPVSNKKAPPAKQQAPATNNQPQFPAANRAPANNNPETVYQVANPSVQLQQQQQGQEEEQQAPETDVQRQLRLLYEKSGREMPEMDLSEMEVPEPQPGVAPTGPGGVPQTPGQFAPPPVPPQKNPNFFERVFLGKKAPPKQAPPPRAPAVPQPRPIVPNGMQPGTPPAANYRPFQANPLGQPAPQGNYGQRPGAVNQPVATPQPTVQQQPPQVMLQRPVGQPQVIPAPQPNMQVAPQATVVPPQATVVPPQQIQNPPQYNPQPTAGGAPMGNPAQSDDIPLLDEEPEESLEIDLTPKSPAQPQSNASPVITPSTPAMPATTSNPTTSGTTTAEPGKPAVQTDPAPAEENPFSGLRLSIPEAAVPAPGARNVPTATPVQASAASPSQTPAATPAANAAVPANPAAPPAATVLPSKDNPFLDDEEEMDEKLEDDPFAGPIKPRTRQSEQPNGQPAATPRPAATNSFELAPIQPPAAPAAKPVAPVTKSEDQSAAAKTPMSAADERLRKLAEATEKTGFKGFCPVALRQKGQLLESKPQFNVTYQGQKFHFSSIAAKAAFEKEPQLFVPMHAGLDCVAILNAKKPLPGSLDHAVWYQGHLYLFASKENRETFVNDPEGYLDTGDTKPTATKTTLAPGKAARPIKHQTTQPATVPADVVVQPAAQATAKPAAQSNDLPVFSDNENEENFKLTPVTEEPAAPAPQGAPGTVPTLTPPDAGNQGTTRDAPAPVTPKPGTPADAPPTGPGPQLEPPIMKKATKNTPASFVVPSTSTRSSGTPPRLISPDLRLAPPVRQ